MKRTPLNKISKKKAQEKRIEAELRAKLLEEHGGLCMECKRPPDFLGLSLHHKLFKSRGGKTEENNVTLICSECHRRFHGVTK